jgi:acetoin utilization protein AcuB
MIVGMWMTRDLATIERHTPISDAAALMAARRVRRLPVVSWHEGRQRLVGIVSAKDILHAFPPDVNPFAAAGNDQRRNLTTIAQIMSTHLHTTAPDTPIEEAAALMAEKKIGALPVVRGSTLVGLITESDIFRVFATFFKTPPGGARITFDLSQENQDVFSFISQTALQRNVRVLSLITSRQENVPVCVVRIAGAAMESFLEDLWNSGHRVLHVLRVP